jgi:hypothetical protein
MEPICYLFIVLFSVGFLYWLLHNRDRMVVTAPFEDLLLGSLNGFGFTMLGGFRSKSSSDYAVYYIMFTLFWLPVFPFGCVIATREGTRLTALLPGINREYRIYGKARWNALEVMSIYAQRWGFLLSLIFLL